MGKRRNKRDGRNSREGLNTGEILKTIRRPLPPPSRVIGKKGYDRKNQDWKKEEEQ